MAAAELEGALNGEPAKDDVTLQVGGVRVAECGLRAKRECSWNWTRRAGRGLGKLMLEVEGRVS